MLCLSLWAYAPGAALAVPSVLWTVNNLSLSACGGEFHAADADADDAEDVTEHASSHSAELILRLCRGGMGGLQEAANAGQEDEERSVSMQSVFHHIQKSKDRIDPAMATAIEKEEKNVECTPEQAVPHS